MTMKNKSRFDLGGGGMPFIPRPQQKSPAFGSAELLDVGSLLTQAMAHHQANRLTEAEQVYRKILRSQPKNYDCLHLLGIIHHQRGEHAEAVRQFDVVLKDNPGFSTAHNNRGNALKELKRFEEALASYNRAIEQDPKNADAHSNRAVVLYELKRFDEALASCERAIALNPDHAQAHNNRGNVLRALNRFDEALASCDAAVALIPSFADALNNRGVILYEMRRFDEALASYDLALVLKADDAEALKNRGNVLIKLKRSTEAIIAYDRAMALDPTQDYVEGLRLFAKIKACDWNNYEAACSNLKTAVANGRLASLPLALLVIPSDVGLQRKCAELCGADKCIPAPAPLWRGECYSHQRIRVAYLSADLREHPVAVLAAGMFEQHDRSRFETIAISFGSDTQDRMRDRLKTSFDRFYDVQAQSDRDVAELIRSLEIDIAVDLNGFTEGSRPNIFAFRPAPVQVNYLGYAGTMGKGFWDYILADRIVVPENQHHGYGEKVVYLPDSFMANDSSRKISDHMPSRADAGLPESGFVFCCFNNNYKITPDVFDIWMRLLREVEGSVLWLSAADSTARKNLCAEAITRGVSPARLIFADRVTLNEDHLARHRLADLFLDTLNYNAHATSCDALWAGLPVLTCLGDTFASRVAGSLLNSIGLPEMVAHSLEEYESLALKLAREPELLSATKQKLARHRRTFPLFNTERFTRHVEAAYATMCERYWRGEAPVSFSVASVD
jgi:protein O-GlcNAc transferase